MTARKSRRTAGASSLAPSTSPLRQQGARTFGGIQPFDESLVLRPHPFWRYWLAATALTAPVTLIAQRDPDGIFPTIALALFALYAWRARITARASGEIEVKRLRTRRFSAHGITSARRVREGRVPIYSVLELTFRGTPDGGGGLVRVWRIWWSGWDDLVSYLGPFGFDEDDILYPG